MREEYVVIPLFLIAILFLEALININAGLVKEKYHIILYGSDLCPDCISLKEEIRNKGLNFEYRSVDNKTYEEQFLLISKVLGLNETLEIPFVVIISHEKNNVIALGSISNASDIIRLKESYEKFREPILMINNKMKNFDCKKAQIIMAIIQGKILSTQELREENQTSNNKIYAIVFTIPYCHSCVETIECLKREGIQVEERDLTKIKNLEMFITIKHILKSNKTKKTPLIIIFLNNTESKLIAIIEGEKPLKNINMLIRNSSKNRSAIYYGEGKNVTLTSNQASLILDTLRGKYIEGSIESPKLKYIIALALSDSINPCTFLIYTAFLITINLIHRGSRIVLSYGFMFILGILIGYLSLGIALYRLSALIPKNLILLIGIILGVYSITAGLLKKPKLIAPKRSYKLLYKVTRITTAI
ncbi:MAG: hypothetical protein J7J99_07815, partial [Thermoprotei archaeon]|nr:hypothetical protein [Thermoprotei archaeon]